VSADGQPASAIERAAAILRAGGLVAFPTETVYGLGADATRGQAVRGIFAAKERPYSDPLIVHVADVERISAVADDVPEVAWTLAQRFWPGPLTLILPRGQAIPRVVTAGGDTVGVRVPGHPVARALLHAAGMPVAAPSANRFMHTSPTTAAHVLADLGGRIDCVLDGGACAVGVESTVLDVTRRPARILRPGGITLEALRAVLGEVQGPAEPGTAHAAGSQPAQAPGQMERHYAPRARLVVFDGASETMLAALRREAEAAIGLGKRVGALLADEEAAALAGLPVTTVALGPRDDLGLITRRLYAGLRTLDEQQLDVILAHTFGKDGLGLALWDRLRRAAGGQLHEVS
jgi:L-threonylcarbamoyladenylate synthase